MHAPRTILLLLSAAGMSGCTVGVVPGSTQTPAHDVGSGNMPMAAPPLVQAVWAAKEREHVDLWLHSYALISQDTSLIPLFRAGYVDRVTGVRRQRGITTLLETNRATLLARMATRPALIANAQLLPLYFPSWEVMRAAIDQFVRTNGVIEATMDQAMRGYFTVLGASFPSAADRDWLRLFAESVDDENTKFHHAYWVAENRSHAAVIHHVDSLWQRQWRPSLQRYLNATHQQNGELFLTFPLGAEGRTVRFDKAQNFIAGPVPESMGESESVLYVMVHEVAGSLVGAPEPHDQAAVVRAGEMLLERTVPLSVNGYMRFYLQAAGKSAPTDPRAAFLATFAMTDAMRDSIVRQLNTILGAS